MAKAHKRDPVAVLLAATGDKVHAQVSKRVLKLFPKLKSGNILHQNHLEIQFAFVQEIGALSGIAEASRRSHIQNYFFEGFTNFTLSGPQQKTITMFSRITGKPGALVKVVLELDPEHFVCVLKLWLFFTCLLWFC